MKKYTEITKDISWVGALDYDIEVFDIVMKTQYGTSYNSYLVKGSEKTVLFETVKVQFFDEFLERIEQLLIRLITSLLIIPSQIMQVPSQK
jgi:flavorubredoxin